MRRLHLIAFVSFFALAGCDLAPQEHLPVVATPVSFKEAGTWQLAQPGDTLPRGHWWHLFGDPQLDALEDSLDASNPDLRAEAEAFAQARAFAREAESGIFPTLSVGGTLSANRQSATRPLRSANQPTYYGSNTIDAEANYEIDLWDRIHNTARAASGAAQASAADLASAKLSLQAELADDYITWRSLSDEQQLLDRTVDAYAQAANLVHNRFVGDIASALDVSRAQAQLSGARAKADDVRGRCALLAHAIAVLVGKTPAELTLHQPTAPLRTPNVPEGLPSQLLERRPDVAAAEREVASAAKLVGVARAAFYPAVSLGAVFGFQSTGMNLVSLPNSMWTLGAGLVSPIFEGGLRQAQLSAAQAALRAATDRYRATVLSAFQDVEDALAQEHWLGQEAQDQGKAAAQGQQTEGQALILYQDGATNYLDVAVAQAAALSAEQALIAVRARQQDAEVALIRALGGGWRHTDLPGREAVRQLAASR